jgi:hypothetical protein
MALLAESLVDEWLNRKGFFTIRGVKQGVGEIDLLAVRPEGDGILTGWHVEVQVSFRPIGYISKIPKDIALAARRSRTSAKMRSQEEVRSFAKEWVSDKYFGKKKCKVRDKLWPNIRWEFYLVHGVVKDEQELGAIRSYGISLLPFYDLLKDLCQNDATNFSASAGGDLAEVVRYYTNLQLGSTGDPGSKADQNFPRTDRANCLEG